MHLLGQGTNRRTTEIGNLYSNILYYLRVSAANEKGLGIPSAASRGVITLPQALIHAVTNVSGGGGNYGTVVVRWLPLSFKLHNGPGFRYRLRWKPREETEYSVTDIWNPEPVKNSTLVQTTITLPTVRFYKPYDIILQAVNNIVSSLLLFSRCCA